MFKASRGLTPEIVNELFQFREIPYKLSLKFRGPKVWALVPNENETESLGKFRNSIKQWKPASCSSRLCKRYIHRIGFL